MPLSLQHPHAVLLSMIDGFIITMAYLLPVLLLMRMLGHRI
jgi:hypothetical protein